MTAGECPVNMSGLHVFHASKTSPRRVCRCGAIEPSPAFTDDTSAGNEYRVWGYLQQVGDRGGTSDEIELDLHILHQSMASILLALEARGKIKKDGRKRYTPRGKPAAVYVAVNGAR